ncbi:MAG: hypothetical protein K2H09_04060, partial [Treponemataceae bacterium]|nr:hypothetical protein [Treponemataceae bacterium]
SDANRYPADLQPGVTLPTGVDEAWFDLAAKSWSVGGSAVEGPEISIRYSDGALTITSSAAVADAMVAVSGGSGSKSLMTADFSGNSAVVDVSSWRLSEGDVISVMGYISSADGVATISQTVTVSSFAGVCIFVQSVSVPAIWMWEADGEAISKNRGEAWPGASMTAAASSDMNDASGWYKVLVEEIELTGKNISIMLGGNNSKEYVFKSGNSRGWLSAGASEFVYADPTQKAQPVPPTVTITPNNGEIALNRSIVVSVTDGNSEITSIDVKAGTKTYTKGNFSGNTLSIPVKELASSAGAAISVSATVKTAAFPTGASAEAKLVAAGEAEEDPFTWDNALVYFVLTDRFSNGVPDNDYSYYRTNAKKTNSVPDVATFHGGDIKGLTDKLDYLDGLGVNAIWLTAPYEQMHGWCSGKDNAFPHYAFHGYYTQDWTYMDQNMGTIEEFRTFVNEAHKRGIRVVMDVVMNHTGYNTVEDMLTYSFGKLSSSVGHGWTNTGGNWAKNHDVTDYTSSDWGKWWSGWVRAFDGKFGFGTPGGDDILMSLSGLPDVMTEKTESVSIPSFLKTKWTNEQDGTNVSSATGNTLGYKYGDYKLPTVASVDWYGKSGDWRADNKGAPADYIVMWLSAWVREFGVDGFRCDTAKHVHMYRWGQLKDACEDALKKWRADTSKSDGGSGAKGWDESFWMTGEHFGWGQSVSGSYFTEGKFDSMINFSFNGAQWSGSGSSGKTPTTDDWNSYASMIANAPDNDGNGNRNSVLSYVSSHDTGLHRPADNKLLGTMLVLLPGGVQIYYGDESARPAYTDSKGDTDMATRGDMNFGANQDFVTHWGKVGTFRKYNPAVGAGAQTVSSSTYRRTYNGVAGESKVAIVLSGSSADVSGLFDDGTKVYNWYDGTSATVSGGKATFSASASGSAPILVSDKDPSAFGVLFWQKSAPQFLRRGFPPKTDGLPAGVLAIPQAGAGRARRNEANREVL